MGRFSKHISYFFPKVLNDEHQYVLNPSLDLGQTEYTLKSVVFKNRNNTNKVGNIKINSSNTYNGKRNGKDEYILRSNHSFYNSNLKAVISYDLWDVNESPAEQFPTGFKYNGICTINNGITTSRNLFTFKVLNDKDNTRIITITFTSNRPF